MPVTESEEVLRIAAKGDGVTGSGLHVPLAAPGDVVGEGGSLAWGPHHAEPVCRHFRQCGGCQLQHCDEAALAGFIRDRVVNAANGADLRPSAVAPVHLSPPRSRRRASLGALNGGGRPVVGFRRQGSHKLVDLAECHVLDPALFALVAPFRQLLAGRKGRYAIEIDLAMIDQGVDCSIKGLELDGLAQMEAMLDFCAAQGLARLTLDQGFGPDALWQPEPVTVTLGGVVVEYPPAAFLQATRDGEAALASAVRHWLAGCERIGDLFAGLGTFAFALAGSGARIMAAEASRDAHLACRAAANRAGLQVECSHRDLFRNPLRASELAEFGGVVLDPPRAGAREQVAQLASSGVPLIAYVSCNPSSWARDAAVLVEAGYELREVRPVGQFRWSTHVEQASLFVKSA